MFLHIDMDAFFASVEEVANPKLYGRPVIVGGLGVRGVVSTANYLARKYGVHSAMSIMQARRLCPYGVYLPVNMALYRKYSLAVREIILQSTPFAERASIDEFYLQYAPRFSSHSALELGWNLKQQILKELGLSCTIGIAPSRTLAKMVSNEIKPAGIRMIPASQVQSFLENKALSEIPGVGQKTFAKFLRYGIRSVADFWATPPNVSLGILGKARFEDLAEKLSGGGLQELNKAPENVSYSSETTFVRDLDRFDERLVVALLQQCEKLHQKAVSEKLFARTLTVKVRNQEFETKTKSKSFKDPLLTLVELEKAAREILLQALPGIARVRLLGLRMGSLVPLEEIQVQGTFELFN